MSDLSWVWVLPVQTAEVVRTAMVSGGIHSMVGGLTCALYACMITLLATFAFLSVSALGAVLVASFGDTSAVPISFEKVNTKPAQLPKATVVSE